MFEVYCHTQRDTQKRYVGLTKQTTKTRWSQHVYAAHGKKHGGYHLGAAIRFHGADSFTHEVLETAETLDAASEAEQWWIAHFGSDIKTLGYNIEQGGTTKGEVSTVTREKMRAAWSSDRRKALGDRRRGKTMPDAQRLKDSESHKALWRTMTPEERKARGSSRAGKPLPPEWRAKLAATQQRRLAREREARALPLFDLGTAKARV